MSKTGAQILVEALLEHDVEYLFGVPGAAIIKLYDLLYDGPIETVLTRHEQGAGHMADGYARATGKVGVCVATSGPGATNLVTAIATAFMDSVPVVALTGQVKTHLIGNDAFQEADMTGITRPITKHNYLVGDVRELGRVVHEAFHIASSGRPGPVLIDLPADVTGGEWDGAVDTTMQLPGYRPPTGNGHVRQIGRAAEAIDAAERPVLYAGGGIIASGASGELTALARKANIPVTTTLMGLGAFPETDELSLGMLGMHGTAYANHAVTNCDLLIAVGARFDDRITGKLDEFAPHARIIHVDIDAASIGKNVPVDIPIVGDARPVLAELERQVQQCDRSPWLDRIRAWKEDFPLGYSPDGTSIKPQAVVEEIDHATDGRAVIVTDVGQHQMWAAQHFRYTRPRTFLSSGGLGTMGYGLPAAIGAQFGRPEEPVFLISGDGSLQMNIQELSTAVQKRLPVKIALLNNGYLGMVRQWQELFYDRRYSGTVLAEGNPDFVRLAEAYGATGIAVDRADQVPEALERAMGIEDGPVLLDFHVTREENVFPMVPAGEAIDRMITGMA
ncbi:MAG: biosynthetic-type acetolactate synthase large subunit [Candidatus Brocadiia bacterium]